MGISVEAANQLETIVNAEFGADGVIVRHDRIHPHMGADSNHYCGISPMSEGEGDNAGLWRSQMMVQMYKAYDPQIEPYQSVDPRVIAGWAERFREAARTQLGVNTDDCWFFRIVEITYPSDPTGNATRFHATVLVFGNNDGLFA